MVVQCTTLYPDGDFQALAMRGCQTRACAEKVKLLAFLRVLIWCCRLTIKAPFKI